MTNYYIYYRVDPASEGSVRLQVRTLFQKIQVTSGIRGRWMRRRDDPSTYMEVYEGVSDSAAFEALLERHGKTFAVPRRQEIFRMANLTD